MVNGFFSQFKRWNRTFQTVHFPNRKNEISLHMHFKLKTNAFPLKVENFEDYQLPRFRPEIKSFSLTAIKALENWTTLVIRGIKRASKGQCSWTGGNRLTTRLSIIASTGTARSSGGLF